jgi:hypothetical protein
MKSRSIFVPSNFKLTRVGTLIKVLTISLAFIMIVSIFSVPTQGQGGCIAKDVCLSPKNSIYHGDVCALYNVPGFGSINLCIPVIKELNSCVPLAGRGISGIKTLDGVFQAQMDIPGRGTVNIEAPLVVTIMATSTNKKGKDRFFDTEMLQLDIKGGNLPAGIIIREDPVLSSRGQAIFSRLVGGNYRVNSFFDVFTELSVDGGQTWTPAVDIYGNPLSWRMRLLICA